MQLPWLSLLFSVQIAGISRGPVIIQSPETLLVQTDKEAKLFCEIRSSKSNYGIFWFRLITPPNPDNHYQFLVHSDSKSVSHGEGIISEHFIVSSDPYRSTLRLLNLKPSDSGIYICTIIDSPKLVFGRGTQVNVVDILPTTPAPTKKTTPKRKVCNTKPSNSVQKNGPFCSALPLSLLMGCIMTLLIPLIVIIRQNYLWNVARRHFVKQLQR
ncbi:T-cell surface glycoprotein CD8 beta chain-like [Macrotis lagotis]|uniref:T-cell surface glycoprotein CD8 beta chain-like n=1 Tax=Macrotis lagotis TaxID=92651 RepID=UPI003D69CE33